jgi:hypothetical protein
MAHDSTAQDSALAYLTAYADFARVNPTVELAFMDWQNGFPQPIGPHWRLLKLPKPC